MNTDKRFDVKLGGFYSHFEVTVKLGELLDKLLHNKIPDITIFELNSHKINIFTFV